MKLVKYFSIPAALALVACLCGMSRADDNLLQQTVTVKVQSPQPDACTICAGGGCTPTNMRDSGGVTTLHPTTNNGGVVTIGQHYCGDGGQFQCGGQITWEGSCYQGATQNGDGSYNVSGGPWGACAANNPVNTAQSATNGGTVRMPSIGNTGYYLYTASCGNSGGAMTAPTVFINKLHCFPAGTMILMCDGTQKAIETIKQGDCVESYNTDTGQFVKSTVNTTVSAEANSLYEITTAEGTLKVTPMHQMYVNGKWAESDSIKPGDMLLDASGKPVQVTSVETITQTVEVYDLITSDPHDFFAENFLVHNVNEGGIQLNHGFVAGTKVAMADGRLLPIEQIKAGDKLVSYNKDTKRWSFNVVKSANKQTVSKIKVINGKLRMGIAQPLLLAQIKKASTKAQAKP